MRQTLKLILIFSCIFVSCKDTTEETRNDIPSSQVDSSQITQKVIAGIISGDTLIVIRKAAVFIQPDSLNIEVRKKAVGEKNFYAGADDYLYYINASHEFLDTNNVTILDANGKKYLKFIYDDKTHQTLKLDTLPDLLNIYFFIPSKKAKQIDMTIIVDEYKTYFK
jgi:hypothetical protein